MQFFTLTHADEEIHEHDFTKNAMREKRQVYNQPAPVYNQPGRYYFYNKPPNYVRREHKFYPSPVLLRG